MIKVIRYSLEVILMVSILTMSASGQQYLPPTNLFIGTSGDNGQVDPAACVPFGMVRVCPDTKPRSHSGYDYAVNNISGFSVNRLSGIGCGGNGGNISIKPALNDSSLSLLKASEKAWPGYYTVMLNNGVNVKLTATQQVAIEQFFFSAAAEGKVTINFASSFTGIEAVSYKQSGNNEINGFLQAATTCSAGSYRLYFNIHFNYPFRIISNADRKMQLSFDRPIAQPVEIRIALSPVDEASAVAENRKVAVMSFEAIRETAAQQWTKLLNKIELKGGTEDDKILFYTSLYRVFLSPANVTTTDHRYLATDGTICVAKGHTYYSSWSMWDNYRTKFPLIALLEPDRMKDIAWSLSEQYIHGKKSWATQHESGPTVRTEHSICVLLDANRKGISGIGLSKAYDAMKREIDSLPSTRPDQAHMLPANGFYHW